MSSKQIGSTAITIFSLLCCLSCGQATKSNYAETDTLSEEQIAQKESRFLAGEKLGQLLAARDFAQARLLLDTLHTDYPKDPQFYFAAGWISDMEGDTPNAVVSFRKAQTLYDARIVAHNEFGDLVNRAFITLILEGKEAYDAELARILQQCTNPTDSLAIEQLYKQMRYDKEQLFASQDRDMLTQQMAIGQLVKFWKAYMEAPNTQEALALKQRMLTPAMQQKLGRINCATGADQLIRAQDVSPHAISSLQCHHLAGDWYEISYRFSPQDSLTYIPLKVTMDPYTNLRISYVTPEWGGRGYGDQLFEVDSCEVVDDKDEATFVDTFYKSYRYPYLTMSSTLEADLQAIREAYCTPEVLVKYAQQVAEVKEDGDFSYDPIIGCEDFDPFWSPSFRISPLGEGAFCISYAHVCIEVRVEKLAAGYRMVDIVKQ